MSKLITLDEFIIQRQKDFPFATGELSGLLRDIGLASKIISREVNKAGLVNLSGQAGVENASGEEVQKLDVMADNLLISCLKNSGEVVHQRRIQLSCLLKQASLPTMWCYLIP